MGHYQVGCRAAVPKHVQKVPACMLQIAGVASQLSTWCRMLDSAHPSAPHADHQVFLPCCRPSRLASGWAPFCLGASPSHPSSQCGQVRLFGVALVAELRCAAELVSSSRPFTCCALPSSCCCTQQGLSLVRSPAAPLPCAAVRLLRRFTGMAAAGDDRVSRWLGRYTAMCFSVVHHLHELLRPVLGCGVGHAK